MSNATGSSAKVPLPVDPGTSHPDDVMNAALVEAPTRIHQKDALPSDDPLVAATEFAQELSGTTLDHFELLDCIGIGGMGQVFRARDMRLDRLVAVKVLSPELTQDSEVRRRFEQEAKAASRLDDPHFARVYYFGASDTLNYIAMEFIEGENLRRMIERHGRLDYRLVVNIGLQIARGLFHAAQRGVVHRDIKPSNIIVTPNGTAKLLDMGLARDFLHHASPASELTQAGVTLGTFDYISPEQARDPRDADVRSDIYSLGCTVYHALSGSPPFPEGTALQKLLQHQTDSAPSIRSVVPDIPEPVAAVVTTMMAKDPKARHQSAAELIRDFVSICQLLDVPLSEEPRVAEIATGDGSAWDRHLGWAVPTIVFLLAIGAFLYFDRGGTINLSEPAQMPLTHNAPTPQRAESQSAAGNRTVGPTPSTTPASRRTDSDYPPSLGSIVQLSPRDDLAKAIRDSRPQSTLNLARGRYEVRRSQPDEFRGIVIDKDLTLRGPADGLAEIVFHQDDRSSLFTLLEYTNVHFERLHLNVQCNPNGINTFAAITVNDATCTIRQCFISFTETTATPAAIETGHSRKSKIVADDCLFSGGTHGLRIFGLRDIVLLRNCAFATAGAYVGKNTEHVDLHLEHVSIITETGPLFDVGRRSSVHFHAEHSAFTSSISGSSGPLIKIRDENTVNPNRDATIQDPWWIGSNNLYYGFERTYVQFENSTYAFGNLKAFGFDDQGSEHAESSPWAEANRVEILKQLQPNRPPQTAFRLSKRGDSAEESTGDAVGALTGPWGAIYSELHAGKELAASSKTTDDNNADERDADQAVNPNQQDLSRLIVDPDSRIGHEANVRQNLEAACIGAVNNSTIELRTNKTISIRSIDVRDKSITIRAHDGYSPTLQLRSWDDAGDSNPRLFRLIGESTLTIDGVALSIDGTPATDPDYGSDQKVLFDCAENSQVVLTNLWVSVGKGAGTTDYAVARLHPSQSPNAESRAVPMLMDELGRTKVTIQNCGIRCKGSILQSDPEGLWTLSIENSFVVAEGAIVSVVGQHMYFEDAHTNILEVSQSTFFLHDSLVAIRIFGSRPQPPRPVETLAAHCIFVGVGGMPLVVSTGSDDARYGDVFRWEKDGMHNFLAGYGTVFKYGGNTTDQMAIPPVALGPAEWLKHVALQTTEFQFGASDVGRFGETSIWDQKVPVASDLYNLDYPADEADDTAGVSKNELPTAPKLIGTSSGSE